MTALMTSIPFAPATSAAMEDRQPLARFVDSSTLTDLLSNMRGAKFTTIQTRTEPKLLAKHPITGETNPFRGNIMKISRVNGMIGWIYANSVNNQRTREDLTPDFEPLPRKWGRRIPGSPLVEHQGALYIELKVERSLGHHYETLEGQEVDAATVEQYLPKRSHGRQGIEKEVILRDYRLESIQSLKLNGTIYILRREPAKAKILTSSHAAA